MLSITLHGDNSLISIRTDRSLSPSVSFSRICSSATNTVALETAHKTSMDFNTYGPGLIAVFGYTQG
ncbi:hypothetical protein BDV41DRAFT_538073 [Aspergillus transmontanensis]|uniref:Uncharacterized protein n=1 Tax=Aspergillus transmontanensis TaxID=1034304 RepID=A0A5N6VWA2_9EURO|nr:hypothetical protein BDV41DRAFT_538073 [Aspergillus transmontanensis]